MSEETKKTPEELFATLASEFLASGLEIDEYIKKKLCERYPDDGEKCAETLTATFAEIDSNHESLRKAKEDGCTRKEWLDLKLGEIVKTVAGDNQRNREYVEKEVMAKIYKTLTGHDPGTLPLDDDHRGRTAALIEDAIHLELPTRESAETTKTDAEKKENN